jgi:hypothetical protein
MPDHAPPARAEHYRNAIARAANVENLDPDPPPMIEQPLPDPDAIAEPLARYLVTVGHDDQVRGRLVDTPAEARAMFEEYLYFEIPWAPEEMTDLDTGVIASPRITFALGEIDQSSSDRESRALVVMNEGCVAEIVCGEVTLVDFNELADDSHVDEELEELADQVEGEFGSAAQLTVDHLRQMAAATRAPAVDGTAGAAIPAEPTQGAPELPDDDGR